MSTELIQKAIVKAAEKDAPSFSKTIEAVVAKKFKTAIDALVKEKEKEVFTKLK